MPDPAIPLEVSLATDVKCCRVCNWFWKGSPPYGPYPAFDWMTDFPPEAVRTEKQPSGFVPPQPWLSGKLSGSALPDPGVMHGCRKAPIMTIGINPNLTAWFPYTSSAPWIYPAFTEEARYAYYYRHFTLYQESLSADYVRAHMSTGKDDCLVAEGDGYVTGSSRENSHNYIQLAVRYKGQVADTFYELVWKPSERWVMVQNGGYPDRPDTWFKKGDMLAGRYDPPTEGIAEIYENAAGYYQRMVPVLDRFKELTNLQGANLTIGEDVAQHDMVACASPGWQSKFDMPMERIAAHCVTEKGWMVSQFVQSQPAFVILVSTSALAMFRSVFGPFMTMQDSGGDIYQLLLESCRRPTYINIDVGPVKFRTRLIVSPHFSYPDGFRPGARLSDAAWTAFAADYRRDAQVLIDKQRVTPDPGANSGPYLVTLPPKDELRTHLGVGAAGVLDGHFVDPFEEMAEALAAEYKAGTITFDSKTGHLRRGQGPCRFCVNSKWSFPEGCMYGKPDEPELPPNQLETAVKAILAKANQAALAEAARAAVTPGGKMNTVAAHIAVAPRKRNLDWIKTSLQTAIMLEHATMPPYIAATYSLHVQNFTAYNLMRSVAMEEMAHMAAACNILAAIGGTPQIKNLKPVYPSYGLPGGAEPDLFVCLASLSKPQLKNFMRLEAPKALIDPKFVGENLPSISTFYAAMRQAIEDNGDEVCAAVKAGGRANQVGDNIGFSTINYSNDCLSDILSAIDSIMAQGEGLIDCALHADGKSEAEQSHYARFAQIYHERELSAPPGHVEPTLDTIDDYFKGYAIPFPVVTNTLAVPADGYEKLLAEDSDRAAVEKDLGGFDQAYSDLMAGLDLCWNGDPVKWWPTLGGAVALMAKLRVLGCFNVMKHRVPDAAIRRLSTLYPDESRMFSIYTRLNEPVFYGPRFRNLNAEPPQNT